MKSQVNGGILTDESTCKLINDCIALFQKDQIDTSLLSFIQMDMDRIDSISYRRIEFLSEPLRAPGKPESKHATTGFILCK